MPRHVSCPLRAAVLSDLRNSWVPPDTLPLLLRQGGIVHGTKPSDAQRLANEVEMLFVGVTFVEEHDLQRR